MHHISSSPPYSCWLVALVLALAIVVPPWFAHAASSAGCKDAAAGGSGAHYPSGNSTAGHLTAPDDRNRTFIVYVPPGYSSDKPSAVVFLFHGGFGSGQQAENSFMMARLLPPIDLMCVMCTI
jgi:poly(3-hydroxybutyrate) depolymerase